MENMPSEHALKRMPPARDRKGVHDYTEYFKTAVRHTLRVPHPLTFN
jgi:hypothetical protein